MANEISELPSYMLAANAHTNLNNGNERDQSVLDAAFDVATKFIPLSVGSGVSQLYNILPTIGNWGSQKVGGTGKEFEYVDYGKVVKEFDSDLSKYYTEHQMGTDALGFALGSFVPGMAGVKVLHAGQAALAKSISAGNVGTGPMGKALGLLAPQRDKHIDAAVTALQSSGNVFKVQEANMMKALISGVGQNALEGAAFTGLVNATMFQSPVLSERSVDDLVFDVLTGAAIGGAVGGLISGTVAGYTVKKAGLQTEKSLAPFGVTDVPVASLTPSDKILFNLSQLEAKAKLDPTSVGEPLKESAKRLQASTMNTMLTDIRTDFQALAGGDTHLAQFMYDRTLAGTTAKIAREQLLGSKAIGRLNHSIPAEKELSAIRTKLREGGDDLSALTAEESNLYRNTQVTFVKVRGEGAGTVTDERPAVLGLADRLGAKQSIALTDVGIKVGDDLYRHANNAHNPFDVSAETLTNVQSRYLWASLSPKFEGVPTVFERDIPLLTKAVTEGLASIKVLPSSKVLSEVYTIDGQDAIKEFTKRQKSAISTELVQMQDVPITAQDFVERAASLLGVKFSTGEKGDLVGIIGDKYTVLKAGDVKRRSLAANIMELKRQEGHSIFQAMVEGSGVTAQNARSMANDFTSPLMQEVIDLSKSRNPNLWQSVKPEQITRRQDPSELFASAFSYLSAHPERLRAMPNFEAFAGHLIRPLPKKVLDTVIARASKQSFAEIAERLDMHEGILRGVYTEKGMFARATAQKEYEELLAVAGTRESQRVAHVDMLPTYVKVVTDTSRLQGLDGHTLDAMTLLRSKAELYDADTRRVTTQVLKEEFPDISDSVWLTGGNSGPGFVTSTVGDLGTRDALSAYVGQRVHNIANDRKTAVADSLQPTLIKVGNDTAAAIEFSVLNETIRSKPGAYKLAKDKTGLVSAEGDFVKITNPSTLELVELHIAQNGKNTDELAALRSVEGIQIKRDREAFYPIPRNLRDTPHYALVIDDTVTGQGHSSMIYAKDAQTLDTLKQKVLANHPEFKVLSKGESEAYFKSQGKFEWERTISDNYMNTALARSGSSASPLPITNPQKIVEDFLDWHLARQTAIVREAVSLRYSRPLAMLRAQAEPHINAAKSTFGYLSPTAYAENAVNNPATNTMKQLLNIQKIEEYPFWTTVNQTLDEKFSKVSQSVKNLWETAVHPEHLAEINKALQKAGYNGPLMDDALYIALNGTVPKGELTSIVAQMNGLLGSIALRADPMNAAVNAISHPVLFGAEAKTVTNIIKNGSTDAANELGKLSTIRLPGTDSYILSPQKVFASSLERLRTNPEIKEWHKRHGFITTIMDQYDQTLDHIAIRAGDTVGSLKAGIAKGIATARGVGHGLERLTGNRLAEEFNRFIAADYMKQVTDIAVKHGLMTEANALPYINSFVNRTQGNFLAAQRPVLFQGPIGQAIGLFQTYQFNLLQQLFRHIGNKDSSNALTMLGLQGTIFGLNGLPAFNAINTYLVGTAGGNTEHKDIYQAIFDGAGKEAGEWLAYGAFSNMLGVFDPSLKTNLYNRGDINPRSLTLVPTDPAKVPIVQATARFFGNMYDSMQQVAMGAELWPTMVRAIEHNGLSRPLAGMAQVLGGMTNESGRVIATNQQGNVLMSHDLNTLVSVVRVLGAKPMDESLVQDAMYRINTYRAHDAAKRQGLGEAIKTSILGGSEPKGEELEKFMHAYVKYGGKQDEFNQFIARQYRNASHTQAEQLRTRLGSNSYLQTLMGGEGGD